jgi:UDP-N-acetylmuramoylalanine--D-glutamate ligase
VELKGQRVLVVGLGKSGVASALFLQQRGARVSVSDTKGPDQLREHIPMLLDRGVIVETGGHAQRTFLDQDLIVLSPGVPTNIPLLELARNQGIGVIGEVELAARFLQGRVVAITGSNGKTTTTTLCGEILKAAGFNTLVGGNIGTPVISLVEKSTPNTWNVLEVSSFQLETIKEFRPDISVVLNVTPDHLDRHGSMQAYVNAKARIFENQKPTDFAVLNADDETCRRLADRLRSHSRWFSRLAEVKNGALIKDDWILWRQVDTGDREILPVAEVPLKGAHNLENVLAAVCVGSIAGVSPQQIRSAVKGFRAVEHRLELVATIAGVDFYNDSKATNVDATAKALESFPGNIHIILGGKDKGSDYTALRDLLKSRAKRVYTVGAAAEKIESHVASAVPVVRAETVENAVRLAAEAANSGDIVLLAPACASFDQFESYEHRGRVFKQTVLDLVRRSGASRG